ncbi:MAG: hypothetical protein N2Z62_10695 [Rhodobacteraceae bacterium]|nr:hypothetical protein [Paracoccaceae bacterium]
MHQARILCLCALLALPAMPAVAQEAAAGDPAAEAGGAPTPEDASGAAAPAPAVAEGALAEELLLAIPDVGAALRALDDPAAYARLADTLALPEAVRPAFAAHVGEIVANDAAVEEFAAAFAARQETFGAASRQALEDIARALGIASAHETATLGVARLPLADQRTFLATELAALTHMGDALCAATARGALDPVELLRAQLGYLATLEPTDFAAHLSLVRAALAAELADDPPFVPLTEAETRRAGEAYQAAAMAAIEADPLRALALEAVTGFDTAPDEAVCLLTRLSLRAALAIEGETGDLVVRLLTAG